MADDLRLNIEDNILYDDVCVDCGCEITSYNDSGWYAFTERAGESQKVCIACWDVRCNKPFVWADDEDNK